MKTYMPALPYGVYALLFHVPGRQRQILSRGPVLKCMIDAENCLHVPVRPALQCLVYKWPSRTLGDGRNNAALPVSMRQRNISVLDRRVPIHNAISDKFTRSSKYLCMRRSKMLAPSGIAARIINWDPGINEAEVHGEAVLKTNAASGLPLCHTRRLESRLEDSRSAPWSSKAQLSRYEP